MLRHEGEEQQAPLARQPASLQLSKDELSEVLNEAIARQSGSEGHYSDVSTLDDALDIARQINVPEEHVLAAAEALRRRKQAADDTVALTATREVKRDLVRQQRKMAFAATVGASVLVTLGAMAMMALAAMVWPMAIVFALVLLTLYQGARAFLFPVGDAEADRAQLPPAAGTCQVCGRPAHASNSTLCEEHRFKGPAG